MAVTPGPSVPPHACPGFPGCTYVQLLDASLIPACPMSSMGCGHELSQDEVERVSCPLYEGGGGRAGGHVPPCMSLGRANDPG